jgi:aminoglycoside 3-N-acetyltransferase
VDYATDRLGDVAPTPFTIDLPVAKSMGAVPETLRRRPGAARSEHPLSSFAAIGADAQRYVEAHAFDDPMLPLRRLHEDGGHVLMLGTALSSCTTIHLGEQYAGRRPFIRWAKLEDGSICRASVGGCSAGFDKLDPWLAPRGETTIGKARLRLFTMADVTETTVRRLAIDPQALICHARCRRCRDAAATTR